MNAFLIRSLAFQAILACFLQAPHAVAAERTARRCTPWPNSNRLISNTTQTVNGVTLLKDFAQIQPVYSGIPQGDVLPTELSQSIVKIQTQGTSGSGTVIASSGAFSTVLTAAHVIEGNRPSELWVETAHGVRHAVKSITVLQGNDLAELIIINHNNQCLPSLPLARSLSEAYWAKRKVTSFQEEVYIIGYPEASQRPRGVTANAIMQSYSAVNRSRGYAIMYHYDQNKRTETGMSGGPVLNRNGYVVGIHGQVDTISRLGSPDSIRTGYGLAVPVSVWINARSSPAYVTTSESSVGLALQGAYQLSTGQIDRSILSLTNAIDRGVTEHRQLMAQKREAYEREVMEPFRDVLSHESQCRQQIEHKRQMRSFYPSPYGMGLSSDDLSRIEETQEYSFCVRSKKIVAAEAAKRYQLEQQDMNAAEHAMAFHGFQHHLYALRSLAYALQGQTNKSKLDLQRCQQLTGGRRSQPCTMAEQLIESIR